jgi:hypothetical protein
MKMREPIVALLMVRTVSDDMHHVSSTPGYETANRSILVIPDLHNVG